MTLIFWSSLVLTLTPSGPQRPIELGIIRWHRKLEVAVEAARKSGKPLLTLFQEVPG